MRRILSTPIRIAFAVTPLTVGVSLGLEWLFTGFITFTTVLIAAPVTFYMAYVITRTMFRYQDLLNKKNKELKKITNELRETNLLISKQNEELDAFAQTIAHELKTPLSVVIGYSHLLGKVDLLKDRERIEEVSTQITQTSLKMNSIIEEMLLFARLRQIDDVQTERLDMARIVDEALQRFGHLVVESQAKVSKPAHWPDVKGYAPWVEEVWSNFISNALKYGGHTPEIELGADNYRDGQVRFWVRDYGRGMSLEQQAQAFAKFTRFDTNQAQGHGLGLSISQRIIEKLGGEVGVESRLQAGSTFYFTLPLA